MSIEMSLREAQLILNAFFVLQSSYPLHWAERPVLDDASVEFTLDRILLSKSKVDPPRKSKYGDIDRYYDSMIALDFSVSELTLFRVALDAIRIEAQHDPYNMRVMVGPLDEITSLQEKLKNLENRIPFRES